MLCKQSSHMHSALPPSPSSPAEGRGTTLGFPCFCLWVPWVARAMPALLAEVPVCV